MAMRTGAFLVAVLAATTPRAGAQVGGRLDLVRQYLGRSQTDSAAAALEAAFASDDSIPAAELADAWLLRGLLQYLAGRDSAGRAAMRVALDQGGEPSLGVLAPRYAPVAVVWASEKVAWLYEQDGRPLDGPGMPPEGAGTETLPAASIVADPDYPRDLARQNIEGDAFIVAVVGPDGRAHERWVEAAYATHPGFAVPAVRSVLHSRFSPATRAGHPITGMVRLRVRFRLFQRGEQPPTVDELLRQSRGLVARGAPDSAETLARVAMDPAAGPSGRHRAAGFAVLAAVAHARGDSAGAEDELRMAALIDSAWAAESLPRVHPQLTGLASRVQSALDGRDPPPVRTGALDPPVFERGPAVHWPPDAVYGVSGPVRLRAVVGVDGRVEPRSIRMLSPQDPALDAVAVEFAVKARFRPARAGGEAVRALVTIPLELSRPPVYLESVVEQKPEVVEGPPLVYPEEMRQAFMQGRVLVEAIVDTLGRAEPLSIRIVSSPHPGFDGAARGYVRWARFRPARAGGRPVRVLIRLPIDFKLRGR